MAGVREELIAKSRNRLFLKSINMTNMEEKYTIILAQYTYGNITQVVNKEKVKTECERLKKIFSKAPEKCFTTIEVVNNQTGESREYWNNHDNIINF